MLSLMGHLVDGRMVMHALLSCLDLVDLETQLQDQGAEQVPSASRSSSNGELQAAAAASGERQQQRRAALCKLANQA
jgi:hypothetical protein